MPVVTEAVPLVPQTSASPRSCSYQDRLVTLLQGDLTFRGQPTGYVSHGFHAFPAKFPPQLARCFIEGLTQPGDVVLDPMMGSGTTLVEACLTGRKAWGFDIDPLARLQTQVKTVPLDPDVVQYQGEIVLDRARTTLEQDQTGLERRLACRFPPTTQRFVDYWFARETQRELQALLEVIEAIPASALRAFLQLVLSSIIITKSGGVTLAFDLAHTRPHRAKVVKDRAGRILLGRELAQNPSPRIQRLTKTLKSPLAAFARRLMQNVRGLTALPSTSLASRVEIANAQCLPVPAHSVDLIVTSPPYAANAIDYLRAHKFSLVWLGYDIPALGQTRGAYIGGETVTNFPFADLPPHTTAVVAAIATRDAHKGRVVHRYYSEMHRVLREMYRVLRPGHAAIVVVGSSVIRGRDTDIATCLAELGGHLGFDVPAIGIRHLDRDRRLLPASHRPDDNSVIQQRMYQEHVLGFCKPGGTS